MKRFLQVFKHLFAGLVGKLFLIANFVICLFVFDWSKFVRYLETPARIDCHIKPPSSIDFSIYGFTGNNYGVIEGIIYFVLSVFSLLLLGLFLILVYPSIAVTEIILQILQAQFPLWCAETHGILYLPVFAVVNSFYWLFLGDMIEIAHSAYLQNKQVEKPLSCFPDSN